MRSSPRPRPASLRGFLRGSIRRFPGSGLPIEALTPQEPRSLGTSYLLWACCLLGMFGLHRFYNRRPASGLLWLVSFGLCGVGQLIDLLQLPQLVRRANEQTLLEEAYASSDLADVDPMPVPLERQLLQLARRTGRSGFTLNDALLDLQLPASIDSTMVRQEIERLLQADLLDVGNDERGRVIYREP
ncbi:MAG: TM2 domain-containing protein [Synechococcaceae cyanobacterium]|jgi:TM2 domain-containing membrane protein YozV